MGSLIAQLSFLLSSHVLCQVVEIRIQLIVDSPPLIEDVRFGSHGYQLITINHQLSPGAVAQLVER